MLVSLGVKGRDEILPPQPEHCQLPANFGFSLDGGAASKPSSKDGSPASPASKGMSGTSDEVFISGAGAEFPPFCFP